jgi:hypothetical protein
MATPETGQARRDEPEERPLLDPLMILPPEAFGITEASARQSRIDRTVDANRKGWR